MSSTSWIRQGYYENTWSSLQTSQLLARLPAGTTLLRTRFAWGFGGTTSTSVGAPNIMTVPMVFGIVTTVGNGSETPPDPIIQSGDQVPPTQRWLWVEQRVPTVAAWDAAASTIVWQSSPAQEAVDSHGQVLAPGNMGVGNTLNVWATWRSQQGWDASGAAKLWFYANLLTKTS